MRNHYFSILCLICCLAVALPSSAQRRRAATKAPAVPVEEQVRAAFAVYDFSRAEELLTTEIAALQRKRQPTAALEQQLRLAQQGVIRLRATERIVIIDSVVVDKDAALSAIRLSSESGRIDTYSSTYHTTDPAGATIYENELANKRYLAIPATAKGDGTSATSLRLAYSDKLGDSWSAPTSLTGLNAGDISQNFPFLLADGITMYYAATGPESMGGYDIFVSRADGEDGSFLAPENVGFPYNSAANDYLLAIDEYNHLGWFVSDRRQPEGKVCVYTFIPNSTRQLYSEDVDDDVLRARAMIYAIRDTWDADITDAKNRLAAVRSGQTEVAKTASDFVFPIDDTHTYTSLDDFHSADAKAKMQNWLSLKKTTETDAVMLERLRDKYATSDAHERQTMAGTIRRLEDAHHLHLEELRILAKDIRNAELTE